MTNGNYQNQKQGFIRKCSRVQFEAKEGMYKTEQNMTQEDIKDIEKPKHIWTVWLYAVMNSMMMIGYQNSYNVGLNLKLTCH